MCRLDDGDEARWSYIQFIDTRLLLRLAHIFHSIKTTYEQVSRRLPRWLSDPISALGQTKLFPCFSDWTIIDYSRSSYVKWFPLFDLFLVIISSSEFSGYISFLVY